MRMRRVQLSADVSTTVHIYLLIRLSKQLVIAHFTAVHPADYECIYMQKIRFCQNPINAFTCA